MLRLTKIITLAIYSLIGIALCENTASAQFPNPPLSVVATDGSSTSSVTVSWSAPSGGGAVSSYRIYRSTTNSFCPGTAIATLSSSTFSYQDVTGTPAQVYYYSLRAVGPGGVGNCSNTDSGFIAAVNPPLAPINVTGSNNDTDKVIVSWDLPGASPAISTFQIFRNTSQIHCSGSVLGTVGYPAISFDDNTAVQGQVYYYSVRSTGPSGISNCSNIAEGYRLEPPPPLPPSNVAASDGTYANKVRVTWDAPTGGQAFTNFKLHRSTILDYCNSLLVDSIPAGSASYDDSSAVPGVMYYYSMETVGPTGVSICSNVDPGYAKISPVKAVTASDGTYLDKVLVTWTPPEEGTITGYNLYRSETATACGSLLASGLSKNTESYNDTTAKQGVIYYYSLIVKSATGDSLCGPIDPGHRKVGGPKNISATDGKYPTKVVVNWDPPSTTVPILSYKLYRDTENTACKDLLVTGIVPSLYTDTSVTPGVTYYYSVKAVTATGESECSLVDPGYAISQCSDKKDNDADGLSDLNDPGCKNDPKRDTEKDPDGPKCDNGIDDDGDGLIDYRVDGKGDPGCFSPKDNDEDDGDLVNPVYSKFNTYEGQYVFAELLNQGTASLPVKISIINLHGKTMISRTVVIPPNNEEIDIDINNMVKFACDVLKSNCDGFKDLSATGGALGDAPVDGIVDTYGLVKLEFDHTNPKTKLVGQVSFYRPNNDGKTFSFAFTRSLKNPTSGSPSYAIANTIDYENKGRFIVNWNELINLDSKVNSFTINRYFPNGRFKDTRRLTLNPLGEFDIQAGHEDLNAQGKIVRTAYLVEVVPDNLKAAFLHTVARYASLASQGGRMNEYNYSYESPGRTGARNSSFGLVSNRLPKLTGLSTVPRVVNVVGLANVSSGYNTVSTKVRSASGSVISQKTYSLRPRSMQYITVSDILPKNSDGVLEIVATGEIIADSDFYVFDASNKLRTGYLSTARPGGKTEQIGNINSYLGMQNIVRVISTKSGGGSANYAINAFGGGTKKGVISLNSNGVSSLSVGTASGAISFPANRYGSFVLNTKTSGRAVSEVQRIRISGGIPDFIIPIEVR